MLTSRWILVASLLTTTSLLLPSDAAALGCWQCTPAYDACRSYRDGDLLGCNYGCDVMYTHNSPAWNACRADCFSRYEADLFQCEVQYEWCLDVCGPIEKPPKDNCPIVLDLGRHGFQFTSVSQGVLFDIDANGHQDAIAWTDPLAEDGFLVLDRDGNGTIDSGLELFGDHTAQPASPHPNGYLALAVYDRPENGGDGDGWITANDAIFGSLRVWVDRDHNGSSAPEELATLPSYGVLAIDLAYKESRRKDRFGNELRYWSVMRRNDGSHSPTVDVFFQRLP